MNEHSSKTPRMDYFATVLNQPGRHYRDFTLPADDNRKNQLNTIFRKEGRTYRQLEDLVLRAKETVFNDLPDTSKKPNTKVESDSQKFPDGKSVTVYQVRDTDTGEPINKNTMENNQEMDKFNIRLTEIKQRREEKIRKAQMNIPEPWPEELENSIHWEQPKWYQNFKIYPMYKFWNDSIRASIQANGGIITQIKNKIIRAFSGKSTFKQKNDNYMTAISSY